MRIRGSRDKNLIKLKKSSRPVDGASDKNFSGLLGQEEQSLHLQELKNILKGVDQKGEALKKRGGMADLKAYKKEVQQFLQAVQKKGLRIRQISSIAPDGSMKLYTVIEKVDDTLEEITRAFMNSEQENLDLINKIEEIRGLLVDLFA